MDCAASSPSSPAVRPLIGPSLLLLLLAGVLLDKSLKAALPAAAAAAVADLLQAAGSRDAAWLNSSMITVQQFPIWVRVLIASCAVLVFCTTQH
jgi:hypothetical protein